MGTAQGDARPQLKDLWSVSDAYRTQYQSDDEVAAIVRLLELDGAAALADLGCGNGRFALAAADANPRLAVWAFDALASAVDECKQRSSHLDASRFRAGVAWVESTPLADASVDRLLCRSVLHHVADPRAAYAEFARLLRPGGLLVLQTPCNFWEPAWGAILSDFYMIAADDSHRRQYHQPGEIIGGLNEAGLLMRRADCWTYRLPGLDRRQADWVSKHRAAERFNLQPRETGSWSVDLYWVRIVAVRG